MSEDVQFSNQKIINSFQTQVALDQLKSDDNSIYVKIQGYNTNGTNIAVSGIEKIEFEDIQALDSSIQLSSPLGTIQEENSQVGESLLFSWYPNIEKGKLVISNQQSLLNATLIFLELCL